MNKLISIFSIFITSLFGALPIMPTIDERYSAVSFDKEKIVTAEEFEALAQAAQLSPSSYNEQPWVFIFCDRIVDPESYEKAFSTVVPFNQNWAQDAQVLIIVLYSKNFIKNGKENRWAGYDTGAAVQSLSLQATYLGLITHQIGGFDPVQIRELFEIDEGMEPISIIALGYPSEHEVRPERKRKPLSSNFYKGSLHHAFSVP